MTSEKEEANISLRITQTLYDELKEQAVRDDRSLASHIRYIIKMYLKTDK